MMRTATSLSAAFLVLSTGVAAADMVQRANTSAGPILVNEKGMTLYTYDKDTAGASNCYDQCARNWPPVMASGSGERAKGLTTVGRRDGGQMYAYQGRPLYLWVKDTKPGDITGEGVGGVWHVAKP
jgi:predicted lipoprotein with Yx(FWY)xxD motif